jgi:DNA-binding beta-propeller fold protein YncE
MLRKLVYFLPLLIAAGCVKDKPVVEAQPAVTLSNNKKVYVVNEGNFTYNNSSLSLYDPGTAQAVEDFFKSQNNVSLGDVAQSLTFFQNRFYIVVNNSGKIVICNEQLKQQTTVTGLASPRYLLPVTNSKAYVSDFKSNNIYVLNLSSSTITGSIYCPGWTEQMALIYNKAFVTNKYRNYLYVINTATDTKSDSVNVGPDAGSVVIDRNDQVWVLSSGDPAKNINASLKRINPLSLQVEKTMNFPSGAYPNSLCLNRGKDTLYYLDNGICRLSVSDFSLPSAPLVAKGSKNFYGLGVNPNDYCIYAADVLDYTQRSNVYVYDANGNQKFFFKAGINSNGFYFE